MLLTWQLFVPAEIILVNDWGRYGMPDSVRLA